MNINQISSWSIRNPIPTLVLFLVLTVAGLLGLRQLRINTNPDIDFPLVAVTIVQPGAAPTEMETQVTRVIEDSVAGLGQVKHITSTVNEGASTTSIEFQLGVDLEKATNDVRNAVTATRANLPSDVQDPIVQRIDISGGAILNYVVDAPQMTAEQLSWYVDNDIAKRMLAVKGVAQVQRNGGVSREIRIKLDPGKLAGLGISAAQVSNELKVTNTNLPGGRGDIGGSEQAIRTLGSAEDIDQLRNQRIALSNGSSVRLGDLGEVEDAWAEQRGMARFNGREVVGFSVLRGVGSSEITVATQARAAIAKLAAERPDLKFAEISSSTRNLSRSVESSVEALVLGAALAVLVVFVFLRDLRATLVATVAMPLSLVPTFWLMQLFNQSLNAVSMLALSLTIGILVDDAIVEIENIVRHIRQGKKPYPAAIEAADEIGLAVVATTATLVAVFAPTGFMPGIVGQFFKAFAFAACVSVLFSLLVARTLTPLMGAYLLRADPGREHEEPRWMRPYLRGLNWALAHRWIMMVMGGAFFVGSLCLIPMLPFEFAPQSDNGRTSLSIQLPPGATLAQTDAVTRQATDILRKRPEVDSVYASIGSATTTFGPGGNSGAGEVRSSTLTINLIDAKKRMSQKAFETAMSPLMTRIPGARIQFGSNEGVGGRLMSLSLVGDEPPALEAAASRVEREMRGVKGLTNVFSSASLVRPEIEITPKADKAALLGVSSSAISQVARVATLGDADQLLPKFNLPDRQIPIRVMLDEPARADLDVIRNLQVPTATNGSVPLSAVADVTFGAGPDQIDRQDRRRLASITAELEGTTLGNALKDVRALPAMKALPPGVFEAPNGQAEFLGELVGGFTSAMATGVLLMYVVLVLLFRSFAHPVTILTALPLSFGGAFFALLIAHSTLSMPAFIGIIMLTGIAAKNSILLVEYALEAMKGGMSRHDALLDAAHKRARPIIMTTVAMAAGMAPIALGLGTGSEFRRPMADAVIGGLITSTLLSLLFVPAAFTLIDDFRLFFLRRVVRRAFDPEGKAESDAADAAIAGGQVPTPGLPAPPVPGLGPQGPSAAPGGAR